MRSIFHFRSGNIRGLLSCRLSWWSN